MCIRDSNNAATWTAIDDELQRLGPGRSLEWIELEYREAIRSDADLRVIGDIAADPCGEGDADGGSGDIVRIWLLTPEGVQASSRARLAAVAR